MLIESFPGLQHDLSHWFRRREGLCVGGARRQDEEAQYGRLQAEER